MSKSSSFGKFFCAKTALTTDNLIYFKISIQVGKSNGKYHWNRRE
ncbi:hypothetical protein [Nostoc sp. C052]|nr:hypothetical protein [Nostoc sp. C052]